MLLCSNHLQYCYNHHCYCYCCMAWFTLTLGCISTPCSIITCSFYISFEFKTVVACKADWSTMTEIISNSASITRHSRITTWSCKMSWYNFVFTILCIMISSRWNMSSRMRLNIVNIFYSSAANARYCLLAFLILFCKLFYIRINKHS